MEQTGKVWLGAGTGPEIGRRHRARKRWSVDVRPFVEPVASSDGGSQAAREESEKEMGEGKV